MTVRYWLYAAGGLLALAVAAGGPLVWLWFRPTLGHALAAGGWLAALVSAGWSATAALTIGPEPPPLRLSLADPAGSWLRLAAGPAGNAAEFAAVTGGLVVACALLAAWRGRPVSGGPGQPPAAVQPAPGPIIRAARPVPAAASTARRDGPEGFARHLSRESGNGAAR